VAEPKTWAEYRRAELAARLDWLQRRLDEHPDIQSAVDATGCGALFFLVRRYGLRGTYRRSRHAQAE
jgi:hypothetical protein